MGLGVFVYFKRARDMAYLTNDEVIALGFKHVGVGVRISSKASIYDCDRIEIGDYSRIDDFCVISGLVSLGKYVHVTAQCLLAGGSPGLEVGDFSAFAYGVKIFTQSDDYSGATMCTPAIPRKFKSETFLRTTVGRQVIVGTGTVVLPGANIAEGCAIGAMSLLHKPTESWGIYTGVPATRMRDRKKTLLDLEAEFLREQRS